MIAVQSFNTFCEESIPSGLPSRTSQVELGWQPPPQDCYKINVDVAISIEQNATGIGVVICDSLGLFTAGRSVKSA